MELHPLKCADILSLISARLLNEDLEDFCLVCQDFYRVGKLSKRWRRDRTVVQAFSSTLALVPFMLGHRIATPDGRLTLSDELFEEFVEVFPERLHAYVSLSLLFSSSLVSLPSLLLILTLLACGGIEPVFALKLLGAVFVNALMPCMSHVAVYQTPLAIQIQKVNERRWRLERKKVNHMFYPPSPQPDRSDETFAQADRLDMAVADWKLRQYVNRNGRVHERAVRPSLGLQARPTSSAKFRALHKNDFADFGNDGDDKEKNVQSNELEEEQARLNVQLEVLIAKKEKTIYSIGEYFSLIGKITLYMMCLVVSFASSLYLVRSVRAILMANLESLIPFE